MDYLLGGQRQGELVQELIGRLWIWANETDPRTWATHAVIAFLIALSLGPLVAVAFYTLREVEQVITRLAKHQELHPLDHVMDVAAPVVAVLPLVLL